MEEDIFYYLNHNYKKASKFICQHRKKLNKITKNGFTPYLYAAYLGKINLLMEMDDDIDSVGPEGMNALHLAASRNEIEVVKYLIENVGMDPKATCDKGLNVLHIACREDATDTIKYLIEKCPELINTQTKRGFTPLHFAAFHQNKETTKILIENGADPNIKNKSGLKPFKFISNEDFKSYYNSFFFDHIITVSDNMVCTKSQLDEICAEKDPKEIQRMIRQNPAFLAPIEKRNGNNIIHEAFKFQKKDFIQTISILNISSEILNKKNNDGKTPLHLYAENKQTTITISNITNINKYDAGIIDNYGCTPLDYAIKNKNSDAVQSFVYYMNGKLGKNFMLEEIYANINILRYSNEVKKRIATTNDLHGRSFIYFIFRCYNYYNSAHGTFYLNLICELLECGGKLSSSWNDEQSHTVLHEIAKNPQCNELLNHINETENIDVLDNEGHTPLYIAWNYKNRVAFSAFLKNGADLTNESNNILFKLSKEKNMTDYYNMLYNKAREKGIQVPQSLRNQPNKIDRHFWNYHGSWF